MFDVEDAAEENRQRKKEDDRGAVPFLSIRAPALRPDCFATEWIRSWPPVSSAA
jgi:hypothetical protein